MKSFLATIPVLLATLLVCRAAEAEAEFRFARIINDRMVLRQEKPIKIWEWAGTGADVSVTLTHDNATGEAAVAAAVKQGTRKAVVKKASEEYSVTVRYGWANWPTVEGVSYSEEAKKASGEKIKALQEDVKSLQNELPAE